MLRFVNWHAEPFLIAHFQGASTIYEHGPAINAFGSTPVCVPDNVGIVSCASRGLVEDGQAMLLVQLEMNNIPYLNPAQDIREWHNPMKIPLQIEALEDLDTEWALVLDAADVLLTGPLDLIFERFASYERKVLFGATKNRYPPITIDKVHNRDWLGEFCFLNAGTAFGKTADLLDFYRCADEIAQQIDNPWDSEQFLVRHAFAQHTDTVGFDHRCNIFQTFGRVDVYEDDEGLVTVT